MVEKTESKKLTNIISHVIQNTHSVNEPNIKASLTIRTDEYVRGTYWNLFTWHQ